MQEISQTALFMDRETQCAAELQALRVLCDPATGGEEQQRLLQALDRQPFLDPEHQVVFESIRALFSRGAISLLQLRVHLNNRGFPDTDTEKYFPPAQAERIGRGPADKITP